MEPENHSQAKCSLKPVFIPGFAGVHHLQAEIGLKICERSLALPSFYLI